LRERHHRPVIAFADAGNIAPDEIRGSARSIPGVHVRDALDAIAARYPGLVSKFGGHAMAAGVSIRRVHFERFAAAFAAEVARWISEDDVRGVIYTDGELQAEELTVETALALDDTGPWGQGFPEPLFHGDFDVVTQRIVADRHTRMVLRAGERLVDAIAFNTEPLDAARIRAVYALGTNDYRDIATLQLVVRHMIALHS
jgi:single-stranded-DNA-specific exonuclease